MLDGGDLLEEELIIVEDCVFPSPPRLKHELENEAGTRIEAWDRRLLCTLGRDELAGYTLVITEPFDIA